jgi:hypothetical protein
MTSYEHQRREATSWAAATLTAKGCTLHPIEGGAWDVELPNGAWHAAEDWRELCAIAREAKAEG